MLAVGSEEAAWVEAAYTATRPQGEEAAFRLLARTDNPRALEPVLDAAQSEDAQRRESACVALAQSGFKRASDELRRLCDDSDADVREAARRGLAQVQLRLGRMGRRASRSPLRRVRRIAEKAARRLPRVEHLAQMADLHYQAVDRGYWDRLSGIWDLPKPDQPAVINAHLDDEDRGMRWAAACSLAQRRGAGLLQRLEALMRDREPEIAALAAQAFDHCQSSALWPGLKRAAESPDDHLRNAAVGAMGSLVAQRVIEDLTGRLLPLPGTLRWMRLNLEDESEQRREQALLVDLLKAKNRDVRLAAALRVAELYDSRGFFQLFELQRYRSYTMDGVIYRATSQLRRKPEFSRLLQLLSDGDEMVRGAGVRALGRMGADLMLEQLLDQYRCAGLSPTWDAVRCAVGRVWGWLSGDEEVADLQLGPLPNAGGYGALTLVTVALIVGVVGLLIFVYLMVALGG
jgi:HEAT repeat protein